MAQLLSAYASPIPNGGMGLMPRASYISIINASSNITAQQAFFYDAEFRRLNTSNSNYYPNNNSTGNYDAYGSPAQQVMPASDYTHTNTGANAGWYPQGTLGSSEFGNDTYLGLERGQWRPWQDRINVSGGQGAARMSTAVVNSDHSDKNKVIQYDNGYLTTSPLHRPMSRLYANPSTTLYVPANRAEKLLVAQNAGDQVAQMRGSASYNNVRKELVVIVYNNVAAGNYSIYLWKGIDFDANGVDVSQLPNTPTKVWSLNTNGIQAATGANFTIETQYNITPILCDDGSIYWSAMYPGAQFRLFRTTRASDDSTISTVSYGQAGLSSPSYGLEQNVGYGQKHMSSRNGALVAVWCPTYYYQSGMAAFFIDKRTSTATSALYNNNANGVNFVKYRDDQIGYIPLISVTNVSSSGAQGINMFGVRGTSVASVGQVFLTEYPNTNNGTYPYWFSLSHVAEYNLQTNIVY